MAFVAIIIGTILIVAAFNNTHGQLAQALEQDVPGFFVWAIAIAAILGLGFIPGMAKPSRWLLALVVIVIVLSNYKSIVAGFSEFAASSGEAYPAPAEPAATASSSSSTGDAAASIAQLIPTIASFL